MTPLEKALREAVEARHVEIVDGVYEEVVQLTIAEARELLSLVGERQWDGFIESIEADYATIRVQHGDHEVELTCPTDMLSAKNAANIREGALVSVGVPFLICEETWTHEELDAADKTREKVNGKTVPRPAAGGRMISKKQWIAHWILVVAVGGLIAWLGPVAFPEVPKILASFLFVAPYALGVLVAQPPPDIFSEETP